MEAWHAGAWLEAEARCAEAIRQADAWEKEALAQVEESFRRNPDPRRAEREALQQKQQQEMLSSMEKGDSVLTSSGFYGVVIDITDDTVIVEFGNNKNCRIPMQKSAITQIEKPNA